MAANVSYDWLDTIGLKSREDAKILEIGRGMACSSKIHSGWPGAEYSKTAAERVKQRDGSETYISEEDAQNLSYQNGCFDVVFASDMLRDVLESGKAVQEINRVLKRGEAQ